MKKRRVRFEQVTMMVNGQPQITYEPVSDESPAQALKATVEVSSSIALIGGALSWAYGWSPDWILPLATAPWFFYAAGKSIYLVVLLTTDVADLFDFVPTINHNSPKLLPIIKVE